MDCRGDYTYRCGAYHCAQNTALSATIKKPQFAEL